MTNCGISSTVDSPTTKILFANQSQVFLTTALEVAGVGVRHFKRQRALPPLPSVDKAEVKLSESDVKQCIGDVVAVEAFVQHIVDRTRTAVQIGFKRDSSLRSAQHRESKLPNLKLVCQSIMFLQALQ